MDWQTAEQIDLYRRRNSPRQPIYDGENLFNVRDDDTPTDGKIQTAMSEVSNGQSVGASQMRTEHLKEWLQGIKQEERSWRVST
jgi:hypothetical protein